MKNIKLPINTYGMMKKYKDENMSFMLFMKNINANADIWGWCNYPNYGAKEKTLMQAWLEFDNVAMQEIYYVPLPLLVTSDKKQQYLSYKDQKYFASRKNLSVQQYFTVDQIPPEYYTYAKKGKIE